MAPNNYLSWALRGLQGAANLVQDATYAKEDCTDEHITNLHAVMQSLRKTYAKMCENSKKSLPEEK